MARAVGECILSRAAAIVDGTEPDKRVEFDHPAQTILEAAKREGYDLIAMGSRGLGQVKGCLLGSVSEESLAPCRKSVIIDATPQKRVKDIHPTSKEAV